MFGLSCPMLEKNNTALITWRWWHDIQLHGKAIFRAQISSRSMGVFKVHNPKMFLNSAWCAAEQICPQSSGAWRPKDKAQWMEGVEDHWLNDYWDNEGRRLLPPFQNQTKFKRHDLLRNPDSDELYLMNNQYPAELIKTALIPARKIDVAWHYQSCTSKDWKDLLWSVKTSVQ